MNIEEFINKKKLDKGMTSQCYLLQNGNVFKQFNTPLNIKELDKFKYFLNFENENILFPFDFVYDTKKFYGYVTKRAFGQTLRESFSSSNLEKLSTHSIKVESNIDFLSKGKILMNDLHSNNIIYDGNLIQIIDPDDYEIRHNYNYNKIKELNFKDYMTVISNQFVINIGISTKTRYIIDKINIYKYTGKTASEFIIKIKDEMEKYTKEKIETVEDFNNIIRR